MQFCNIVLSDVSGVKGRVKDENGCCFAGQELGPCIAGVKSGVLPHDVSMDDLYVLGFIEIFSHVMGTNNIGMELRFNSPDSATESGVVEFQVTLQNRTTSCLSSIKIPFEELIEFLKFVGAVEASATTENVCK